MLENRRKVGCIIVHGNNVSKLSKQSKSNIQKWEVVYFVTGNRGRREFIPFNLIAADEDVTSIYPETHHRIDT